MKKVAISLGGLFALLAVILGAFAAHALKTKLSAYSLGVYTTGVTYQMYHGLALILVGILVHIGYRLRVTVWCFTAGCLLFSGSLYALALTEIKWFGPITPLGGMLFIIGWIYLIAQVVRSNESI
ncbi:DUF423 domain-containing protein [Pseudoalteromonas xiamenensis]